MKAMILSSILLSIAIMSFWSIICASLKDKSPTIFPSYLLSDFVNTLLKKSWIDFDLKFVVNENLILFIFLKKINYTSILIFWWITKIAPISKKGNPIIKSNCHCKFSNTVEISKAITGISTPT